MPGGGGCQQRVMQNFRSKLWKLAPCPRNTGGSNRDGRREMALGMIAFHRKIPDRIAED